MCFPMGHCSEREKNGKVQVGGGELYIPLLLIRVNNAADGTEGISHSPRRNG